MAAESAKYFARLLSSYQSTEEEKLCAAVLFNDLDIFMGDKRLNHLAALTWNAQSCDRLFAMVEKAIVPAENPWKTIYKSLLVIHTILLYGSELAVDKAMNACKYIHPLQSYNSALVRRSYFSTTGGMDHGQPVRAAATALSSLLMRDEAIRQARAEVRTDSLVPLGEDFEQHNPSKGVSNMSFGQGLTTSVGAGFGIEAVPGLYDGRPDRYFDNQNDPVTRVTEGNSQITRDAMAPSLLDLVFDSPAVASSGDNLPQAEYIPALQKQQELEKQLREQQKLLRQLQEQQAQTLQQQLLQQQQQFFMQQQQQQQHQVPAYQQQYPPQSYPHYGANGASYFPASMQQTMPSQQQLMQQQQQQQVQQQQQMQPQYNNYPPQQTSFMSIIQNDNGPAGRSNSGDPLVLQQPLFKSSVSFNEEALQHRSEFGRSDSHHESSYLEQFTAQYHAHHINYAPEQQKGGSVKAKSVMSRANSVHEMNEGSPLHWSFDHNGTAVPAPPMNGLPPTGMNEAPMGPPPPVPSFQPMNGF